MASVTLGIKFKFLNEASKALYDLAPNSCLWPHFPPLSSWTTLLQPHWLYACSFYLPLGLWPCVLCQDALLLEHVSSPNSSGLHSKVTFSKTSSWTSKINNPPAHTLSPYSALFFFIPKITYLFFPFLLEYKLHKIETLSFSLLYECELHYRRQTNICWKNMWIISASPNF